MKTTAKVNIQNDVFKVKFDIFEAVWGYLLYDNIGLLADSQKKAMKLFSFTTGKEQTTVEISTENIEELSKSKIQELNFSLGNNKTAIFKKEVVDVTGKFIEAIEAQVKGKISTAIECFKAVLEANPNNYRAFGLLGRCFRTEGKMDEAYECYKKAIELAPESPEAYCNLGVLFQKEGDEEKAQAAFLKAIEVDNFYCNALVKRATWLLNNAPGDYELKLYNLRLSAVHQDVNSAQNHLKAYLEKTGYERIEYSDKETAVFGDFADYKLQKKLKIIESCINNGAYATALDNMKEVLESTKGTSAEKRVAGWCHSRASRSSKRLGDTLDFDTWKALNELVENTPSEDDLKQQAAEFARKEELEAAMKIDRKVAEATSKAAIAAMENKVSEDGDYAQPIAVPIEKKVTEEEKDEALAEQSLLSGEDDIPVPSPTPLTKSEELSQINSKEVHKTKPIIINKPVVTETVQESSSDSQLESENEEKKEEDLLTEIYDMPAPKPISEDSLLTGVDDIPAPKPVGISDPVIPKAVSTTPQEAVSTSVSPSETDDLLLTGVDNVPAPKPISEDSLLTGVDDIPAPKPVSIKSQLDKTISSGVVSSVADPSMKPMSTAELMAKASEKPETLSESEPSMKPMSTAELMAQANEKPETLPESEPSLKPMSTAELMAQAKNINIASEDSEPLLKPKSTAELMAEAKNVVLPPKSVLSAPKEVGLNEKYQSPIKDVKPVTIQEFFMLVLFEVMRDGEIEEPERKFLANLKNFLKISDNDFTKMFNHIKNQVKAVGKEQGKESKFNPKRVFKNLCKLALRDGVLEDSEKKLLIAASKLFKINEQEFKTILLEAKNK